MAYTPPVGTADLTIGSVLGYTLPIGTANLSIGHTDYADRTAEVSGLSSAPTGLLAAIKQNTVSIVGVSVEPTGFISASNIVFASFTGISVEPTGLLDSSFDPNLLSEVHAITRTSWRDGLTSTKSELDRFQSALLLHLPLDSSWREAIPATESTITSYQQANQVTAYGLDHWREGLGQRAGEVSSWRQSLPMIQQTIDHFQAATHIPRSVGSNFLVRSPLPILSGITDWQDSILASRSSGSDFRDGLLLVRMDVEIWQPAGYPGNALNPGPPIPPSPTPWPWGTILKLRCPLPGTTLRIRRTPCSRIAEREIPLRRDYVSVNSASLTLLPDRIPLPCTSMTIATDLKSWCWGLTASLNGAGAFAMVQPTPAGYPVEVEATINDWVWTFVLDYPALDRAFNKHNLSIQGRSRSAWLAEPWTPRTMGFQSNARTARQLAEEALENTGWTLDWQLDDWLVPAKRFEWDNDGIGRIMRILNPVAGKLYTHPTLQVLKAYPPYPVASWLLAGESADIELPSNIVAALKRTPKFTPAYNGVYVSGTSDGVLALVKIAGTDGMIQPDQPIVEALCCDEDGVAARMRGLAFLSENAGCGYSLNLQTLLGRYGDLGNLPSLLIPNTLVLYESMKGLVRGLSINASHAGGWTGVLQVRQNIEVEFWEVES